MSNAATPNDLSYGLTPLSSSVEDGVFMEFRVNAQPTAATVQKVSDAWVARWDTTLLANGVYWVAIEVQAGGNSGAAACWVATIRLFQ